MNSFRQIASIFLIGQFGLVVAIGEEVPHRAWLTGTKLQHELDSPFSGSWTRSELREMLNDVSVTRQISIVLDRRLDPSAQSAFNVKDVSLRTGLGDFARLAKGELSLPSNFVYIGTPSSARQLRTIVEQRKLDLQSKEAAIPDRRRQELQKPRTVQWCDLDRPSDILSSISGSLRLAVANEDMIPHDLWAGAVLPDVSPIEAISVILIQFDLTFRWGKSGTSIELVSIPEHVSIERSHHSKLKPGDAVELIHQKYPDLDVKITRSDIVVTGTVEDHESVGSLLRGDRPAKSTQVETSSPLQKRKFTFSVEAPVPLIAIMHRLEEDCKIQFEYNQEDLKAAAVDLEQSIQLDVTNVTTDEFFKRLFGPARLDFQIDRQTVKLKPKKPAAPIR